MKSPVYITWEWWGRPSYKWMFRAYRTAKGGYALLFGTGIVTVRWVGRG